MAEAIPSSIRLIVVTRERKILDEQVEEVVLPGWEGALGILPGHTPLLALLRIGELAYRTGGHSTRLAISWGLAEVLPDRVIVLCEGAYLSGEIDVEEAERERLEAEKELASLASHDEAFLIAQAKLEESIAKIRVVRGGPF
ncbi:MAG TPA: ATP synthase F1 subunit epsilon [Thermoanaerobaculia bacterium]|nr:ATP synthase F1 subunit epsilon [Thermoanaerobaculia bacterium]